MLIGRAAEMQALRAMVTSVRAGRGGVALVEGEPGIGKSTLIKAMAAEAESEGCLVFRARCDELSEAFPLLPLREPFRSGLPEVPGAEQEGLGIVPGDRVDMVGQLVEQMVSHVEELCLLGPVALVIDDLQWADSATVIALGRLVRLARATSLFVLGATRPIPQRSDLDALRRAVGPDSVIRLEPFIESEVVALVQRVTGRVPGPRLLARAADAAGNPLYLIELLDALQRGGILTIETGRTEINRGAPTIASLSYAIMDRLGFLTPAVRRVLDSAALLGTEFRVLDLAVILHCSVGELVPLLDQAMAATVLQSGDRELMFRHPLIRDALYDAVPLPVRKVQHREVAKALAGEGAPSEQVARQLLAGAVGEDSVTDDDAWIVRWLVTTGRDLIGRAPRVAVPLLTWAYNESTDRTSIDSLACLLADALYRIGSRDEAEDLAYRALITAVEPDHIVDLHWILAQCRTMNGRSAESLVTLHEALEAPALGPKHRARLLVLVARTERTLGQPESAMANARSAVAAAESVGDAWALAWGLGQLAILYGEQGQTTRALPLFVRAQAAADNVPELADLQLLLKINYASAVGDLGRHQAAIETVESVLRQAVRAGNTMRTEQALGVLTERLLEAGRWGEALSTVKDNVERTRHPIVRCAMYGFGALIDLHRNDDDGYRYLAWAEPYATTLGSGLPSALVLARSLAAERTEGPAQALQVLLQELSDNTDQVLVIGDLLPDAMRLATAVHDDTAVKQVLTYARKAETSPEPYFRAVVRHVYGLAAHDPVALVVSADAYHAAGRLLRQAQALEAAGRAATDRSGYLAQALSIYLRLNAAWDIARVRDDRN